MKNLLLVVLLFFQTSLILAQEFVDVDVDSEVTEVQPMTGMVFWPENKDITTNAISLEYSYMDFSKIVMGKGVYDWTVVDDLLDEMAGRNHQAVLRFRFSYPGKTTTVPRYIKDLADYNETEGLSEGQTTYFPDWTNTELRRFTLEFYEKYAARYDNDPRLAFVQAGFGLWAEYHIYDGPFELGVTFPSKAFQTEFFNHLKTVFVNTFWSISVDAADATYSPLSAEPELKDIEFGVFDDSFMHDTHSVDNEPNWNFFDRERYNTSPAGGEFSYYSDYDQRNVLNPDEGAYGDPYEIWAQNFHITYINANDQNSYHPLSRVKEASMASGYKFKLKSFKTKADSSIIEVINLGVAPIYIDAYITINGVRSKESLKLLSQDESMLFHISAGGDNAVITIESDDILPTETIQYFGTVNDYQRYVKPETPPILGLKGDKNIQNNFSVYPTIADSGKVYIESKNHELFSIRLYNVQGRIIAQENDIMSTSLNVDFFPKGVYLLVIKTSNGKLYKQKLLFQ